MWKPRYFLYNKKSIVITKSAYKKIKKEIKTAVITNEYGYILVSFDCHRRFNQPLELIYQYETVDGETMCDGCALRLEQLTGDCSKEFRPLQHEEEDLTYLITLMNQKGFIEDNSIRQDIRARWNSSVSPTSTSPVVQAASGIGLLLVCGVVLAIDAVCKTTTWVKGVKK